MIVRELMKKSEKELEELSLDPHAAKVLFYHFAKKEPHELYLMMDEEVDENLYHLFMVALDRYKQGEPVQYIKGVENFFGRDFVVNEHVLIPRYETEELVEQILYRIDDYFAESNEIDVCDIGTGSGAIAISLKCEEPRIDMKASDISVEAIEVAQKNADRLDAKVTFYVGDMVKPFIEHQDKVDILVSNPPYIPVEQKIELVVKDHEPHVALFGGKDGLYFYRRIFEDAPAILKDKAILAFEIGYDQKEQLSLEVEHYFPGYPYEIIKDMNGKDRMLFIYKNIK